ncbi:MAG: hypothetical protein V1906_02900, partial [Candidatus Woesearchaeota archaeon]
FLIVLSYNVIAVTHSGTEFSTSYDKEKLEDIFSEIYPGKSGTLALFNTEDTSAVRLMKNSKYYGNIAGNVKVLSYDKEGLLFKISVAPLSSAKVPTPKAVYFNYYGPGGKMLALKSDSIILEQTYFGALKIYRLKVRAKGGVLYQQDADKVLYCKDCTFEYDQYYNKYHVIGKAVAMSLSDYKKLENSLASSKDPLSVVSSQLKVWDYLELKDLKWMTFLKTIGVTYPYKEFDDLSKTIQDKPINYVPTFRVKAVPFSKSSAIGDVKMRGYGYVGVEVAKSFYYDDNFPSNENYAFYALKGSGIIYDFPAKMLFKHTGKTSGSTGRQTVLFNGDNYMYLYGENVIGLLKKQDSEEKDIFYQMNQFIYGGKESSFHASLIDNVPQTDDPMDNKVILTMPVQESYPSDFGIDPSVNTVYKFTVNRKFKSVAGRDIVRSIVLENCKLSLPSDVPWYDFGMDLDLTCTDEKNKRDLVCVVSSKECKLGDELVNTLPGQKVSYER